MEVITISMLSLATSAVRGSPKMETKLPERLITIRDKHAKWVKVTYRKTTFCTHNWRTTGSYQDPGSA